jgi:hypothetical protein
MPSIAQPALATGRFAQIQISKARVITTSTALTASLFGTRYLVPPNVNTMTKTREELLLNPPAS